MPRFVFSDLRNVYLEKKSCWKWLETQKLTRTERKWKNDTEDADFQDLWQTNVIVQGIENYWEKEVKGRQMKGEIESQDFLERKKRHL